MLDPDHRALYADALRPPPGHIFGEAIATTYTLGLDTLLTVPLQLALFDRRDAGEALDDGVAILEALRRTSQGLSVFYQEGRIHVPAARHVLFSLLEPVVHAVRLSSGGAFHAKLWAIRFTDPTGTAADALRVLVLSRNLTFDRSWDLSLRLDGEVVGAAESEDTLDENASIGPVLADFVRRLPSLVTADLDPVHRERAERVADALATTRFELPPGFRSGEIFVRGLGGSAWFPDRADELAIVSPFCDDTSLEALAKSAKTPLALVSRAEELDRLSPATRARFERVLVLEDSAETEDGEDTTGPAEAERLRGLHAKVYLARRGADVSVVLGSANATRPGLLDGRNVEILVALVGRRKRVGDLRALVEGGGLGEVLVDYQPPEESVTLDADRRAAEGRLDAARDALARAGFELICGPASETSAEGGAIVDATSSSGPSHGADEEAAWSLRLDAPAPIVLEGITSLHAWPVTVADEHATSIDLGRRDGRHALGRVALVSVTSLIAFELATTIEGERDPLRTRFVLNLPLRGRPAGREAALLKTVLRNQEGFLRYLALLLAELDEDPLASGGKAGAEWAAWLRKGGADELALLEPLVRALARDPERLEQVRHVVERIASGEGTGAEVIPTEFLELWASFEQALAHEADPGGRSSAASGPEVSP